MSMRISRGTCLAVCVLFLAATSGADDAPQARLARGLKPLAEVFCGASESFELTALAHLPIDGQPQEVRFRLNRDRSGAFDLEAIHQDYAFEIRRRENVTAFVLPRHNVAYIGQGEADPQDQLAPEGFWMRAAGPGTLIANYLPLLSPSHPDALAALVGSLVKPRFDAEANQFRVADDAAFSFPDPTSLRISGKDWDLKMSVAPAAELCSVEAFPEMKTVGLDRRQLERQLARGMSRLLELLAPSPLLAAPLGEPRKVPHGELRWIDGHRVALLKGTPEEVGQAHGQLLQAEAFRCIDSVLNVFGTVQTIRTGRWFRDELQQASARLLPHIPQRHREETRALAASLDLDPKLVEELNVFPELFHCSGFAVFGSATKDGKLYHGRVLDYMTMIGLQDCAVTFVMQVDGQIPFANVGYAGFIGSVSGMNTQAISLGEMGGRGEGNWDGVPMATLMRRALEECSTLDEVMALWQNSPRTCEYFYVFADGKTKRAVGVAARPESIEFVFPGQAHPLLGEGIPDAVVLSAGSRLAALRQRVQDKHGQIDAQTGQWLMCRPVAMKSNLHNVLFVPEDGVLYVANANHSQPAAERPYVRLDVNELLGPSRPSPGTPSP